MIIAIDNGSSGAMAIYSRAQDKFYFYRMKNFTLPSSEHCTRLDFERFYELLQQFTKQANNDNERIFCVIEKPLTGAKFSARSIASGARFHEAQLIAIERCNIGYEIVTSSRWQRNILAGVKGRENLKEKSRVKGIQMFPEFAEEIKKQKDADALLMCFYYSSIFEKVMK